MRAGFVLASNLVIQQYLVSVCKIGSLHTRNNTLSAPGPGWWQRDLISLSDEWFAVLLAQKLGKLFGFAQLRVCLGRP